MDLVHKQGVVGPALHVVCQAQQHAPRQLPGEATRKGRGTGSDGPERLGRNGPKLQHGGLQVTTPPAKVEERNPRTAPGNGSSPWAMGCSLCRLRTVSPKSAASSLSAAGRRPASTSSVMRRRTSSDCLSSLLRSCWSSAPPSKKFRGKARGSAKGPRVRSRRTSEARESASMAATPSSISRSCKKLPSGEKTTSAISRVAESTCRAL